MRWRHIKRITCLTIVLLLMVNGVFGANFKDLKDAEWAEPYINKMATLGVISGYNGEFMPNDSLSKYAAISTIYRTLEAAGKLEDENMTVLKARYANTMSTYDVPDWTGMKEAVAFCLDKEIISANDLSGFMIAGAQQNATRSEVSVYLGKALNLYMEEDLSGIISLNFKDASLITTSAAPYVDLLVDKKIISGTPEGYFKPYDEITRAAMAKMLSDSYDLLKTVKKVELSYDTGNIAFVLSDTEKLIVSESEDSTDNVIYDINSDVKIYKDGKQKTFEAFEKGQDIKLGFSEDMELVRIDILTESGDVSGYLRDIESRTGYYQIEIYDENDDDERKDFNTIDSLSIITLDGNDAKISELERGDYAKLVLDDDNRITKIVAEAKYKTYEGILKSGITYEGKPKLKIQLDSSEVRTFELDDDDVDIERNDDNADMTELAIGDYVKIKTAYGKIVDIKAESVKQEEIEGEIKSILIADTPIITIIDEDGDERELKLHSNAEIEIDNDDAEYYDLKAGYEVEIELDGNYIMKLDAEEGKAKDQLSGTITKVYKDLDVITIKNKSGSSYEYTSINYNNDTEILDSDGDSLRASALDEDDVIFIYGSYQDSFFLAEKIILLD